ncbi:MAG: PA0069 family radical SAM protein [Bacteroidetes bacterium]|nr:PA0069 family radical SAM protein [Bacteroidota bacterium]
MKTSEERIKGRGAQKNSVNPYSRTELVYEHPEGLDEKDDRLETPTEYTEVYPKSILNRVESPDIGLSWSMNPYQGCEHGCIYCYARNTHNYWGYSAGTEFEQKILVKKNAVELLENELAKPNWKVEPVMLSGNTDCYQPAERKFKITRQILQVFLKYRHPVGVITKNALILRDLDLLKELGAMNLVQVAISFTSMREETRRLLEPRTSSVKAKLKTIETLSAAKIPVTVMMAPVIPSINSHEIFELGKAVSEAGASSINHLVVRLNGAVGPLFEDWIKQTYPDRAGKVLGQIRALHGGKLNDSRTGVRMRGEGVFAQSMQDQFALVRKKYFKNQSRTNYNLDLFVRRNKQQILLF